MFRKQFLAGCVLIVVAIAWPTVSIVSSLRQFSATYKEAARDTRSFTPSKQSALVYAVKTGLSSLIGGMVVGMLGVTMALGAPGPVSDEDEASVDETSSVSAPIHG